MTKVRKAHHIEAVLLDADSLVLCVAGPMLQCPDRITTVAFNQMRPTFTALTFAQSLHLVRIHETVRNRLSRKLDENVIVFITMHLSALAQVGDEYRGLAYVVGRDTTKVDITHVYGFHISKEDTNFSDRSRSLPMNVPVIPKIIQLMRDGAAGIYNVFQVRMETKWISPMDIEAVFISRTNHGEAAYLFERDAKSWRVTSLNKRELGATHESSRSCARYVFEEVMARLGEDEWLTQSRQTLRVDVTRTETGVAFTVLDMTGRSFTFPTHINQAERQANVSCTSHRPSDGHSS